MMKHKNDEGRWAALKTLSEEMIFDYLHGNITPEEHDRITLIIEKDEELKSWFLKKKTEHDIERFFDNLLTDDEEFELMLRIYEDETLKEHFKLYREVYEVLHSVAVEQHLREELGKLNVKPCEINIMGQFDDNEC